MQGGVTGRFTLVDEVDLVGVRAEGAGVGRAGVLHAGARILEREQVEAEALVIDAPGAEPPELEVPHVARAQLSEHVVGVHLVHAELFADPEHGLAARGHEPVLPELVLDGGSEHEAAAEVVDLLVVQRLAVEGVLRVPHVELQAAAPGEHAFARWLDEAVALLGVHRARDLGARGARGARRGLLVARGGGLGWLARRERVGRFGLVGVRSRRLGILCKRRRADAEQRRRPLGRAAATKGQSGDFARVHLQLIVKEALLSAAGSALGPTSTVCWPVSTTQPPVAPVRHVARRHAQLDGLHCACGQRHAREGLELLGRAPLRRVGVADVELDDLGARHLAGVGHVDLDVQPAILGDAAAAQHAHVRVREGRVAEAVPEPEARHVAAAPRSVGSRAGTRPWHRRRCCSGSPGSAPASVATVNGSLPEKLTSPNSKRASAAPPS